MGVKDELTCRAAHEEHGQPLEHDEASPSALTTPIQEFYSNTKILVTGATGFLGKALVEKLLRCCHQVDTIYYLVRTKKGVPVGERHEKLIKSSVFERIREKMPHVFEKLVPVAGDVGDVDLGLSPQDRLMLIQNVNVVFHSAATVRFNEKIDTAFSLNTVATIKVLELCKNIKKLKALVHVSTAYSNSDKPEIREEVYPAPAEIEKVLEVCKIQEDRQQEASVAKILGRHPNTYTLTKALAESIVNEHAKELPVCIVRPSIVTGAMAEPMPGWVDNFSAVSGIMVEIGRGTLKSIIADETQTMDVIPVDLVVNTLITSAWRTGVEPRQDKATVYNCTSGELNPISWYAYGRLTEKYSLQYPSKYIMFYPGFSFRTNVFIHWIITFLFQVIPAVLLDTYLFCTFQKTYVLRLVNKFIDAIAVGSFFSLHGWKFHADNMVALQKSLSLDTVDGAQFSVDVKQIKWEKYVEDYVVGLRQYALRDSLSSLPAAKRKQNRIWWISSIFNIIVMGLVCYMVVSTLTSFL